MSMQEFLDGDCGNLNPVLKVASHFTQDNSLRETLARGAGSSLSIGPHSSNYEQEEQLLRRYYESGQAERAQMPPSTFRMENLMKEIQEIENHGPQSHSQAPSHEQWTNEYMGRTRQLPPSQASNWKNEYMAQHTQHDMNLAWASERPQMHSFPPPNQIMGINKSHIPSAQELLDDSRWVNEYNEPEGAHAIGPKTPLQLTAEGLMKTVDDPNIKATEFMKFVEKVSTGEIKLDEREDSSLPSTLNQTNVDVAADQWANQYEFSYKDDNIESQWADEFIGGSQMAANATNGNIAENNQDFWKNLQDEWDRLAREENETHPWLQETNELSEQEYVFHEANPFNDVHNPFEEGKKRLAEGDIPSAVLLFEMAAQKDPGNHEVWLLLGTTLAQNEQDPLAIRALNKTLELDPNNSSALMALAASYTNESFHLQACNTLQNWLKAQAKYSELVQEDFNSLIRNKATSILPSEDLIKVQRCFINAARLSPRGEIDPDVQCGLGILFNLGSDYDKAADCFRSAISMHSDNSLLWNRLGASLANGGKSAEAIGAYRRALEISPGFIRTRYNLGISCVNLGAYREAAEHFLSALNQQNSGKTSLGPSKNVMSDSIWNSIRMMLHVLGMADLTSAVDRRDLDLLNKKFNMEA